MKRVTNSHQSERTGVHAVAQKVHENLGWIFRDQDEDFGIDAQFEVVTNHRPSGKIIAVQIKSGSSYFTENTTEGFVFRGEQEHLSYWLGHDLPVIVVLYDSSDDTAYWQSVSPENIEMTGVGWKMTIPRSQRLEAAQATNLEKLASKQEQLRQALAEFTCPYCGAALEVRGGEHVGPNDEHYGMHEIFRCGCHLFDGYPSRPCPNDPEFPDFEDFKLEFVQGPGPEEVWHCIANPKSEKARLLHLIGSGKTMEEAQTNVREKYNSYAKKKFG